MTKRKQTKEADRAKDVALAAAIFDPEGKIMVTPEGLLPTYSLTNTFIDEVCLVLANVYDRIVH